MSTVRRQTLPNETNVVRRLLALGFEEVRRPGITTMYVSDQGDLRVQLARSKQLQLGASSSLKLGDLSARGSVNVHRAQESEPVEQRREAFLVANGPYAERFQKLVRASGHGSIGNALAWHSGALEELLLALERPVPDDAPSDTDEPVA